MRIKHLIVGFAALALLGAGCGDDDSTVDNTGTQTDSPTDAATDLTDANSDSGSMAGENVITVRESDYAYAIDDGATAGTVSFAIENTGNELHMFGLCKLADGKSLADVQTGLQSEDESALESVCSQEGPFEQAGGFQSPGAEYTVTADGIEAGNYVAICFLPDAEGTPHFAKGMMSEFTIAEGEGGEMPEADVEVTATPDKLEGIGDSLPAGSTTFSIEVEEGAPDEVTLVKLKDGKTPEEADAYFKTLDEGGFYDPAASPAELIVGLFDSTEMRTLTTDLTPGTWALLVEDTDDESAPELPPSQDPHVAIFTVA